jgi:hypothetical protein
MNNIEDLRQVLMEAMTINDKYCAILVAKDQRILSMQGVIDDLEKQRDALLEQWRATLPSEVSE